MLNFVLRIIFEDIFLFRIFAKTGYLSPIENIGIHALFTMSRIEKEKQIIEQMIRLYCKKKEGHPTLCPECEEILQYALKRLDNCPFGEEKSSCKHCPVHCYKPQMKSKIRLIMRYMGPRMIWQAPLCTLKHLFKK